MITAINRRPRHAAFCTLLWVLPLVASTASIAAGRGPIAADPPEAAFSQLVARLQANTPEALQKFGRGDATINCEKFERGPMGCVFVPVDGMYPCLPPAQIGTAWAEKRKHTWRRLSETFYLLELGPSDDHPDPRSVLRVALCMTRRAGDWELTGYRSTCS